MDWSLMHVSLQKKLRFNKKVRDCLCWLPLQGLSDPNPIWVSPTCHQLHHLLPPGPLPDLWCMTLIHGSEVLPASLEWASEASTATSPPTLGRNVQLSHEAVRKEKEAMNEQNRVYFSGSIRFIECLVLSVCLPDAPKSALVNILFYFSFQW